MVKIIHRAEHKIRASYHKHPRIFLVVGTTIVLITLLRIFHQDKVIPYAETAYVLLHLAEIIKKA